MFLAIQVSRVIVMEFCGHQKSRDGSFQILDFFTSTILKIIFETSSYKRFTWYYDRSRLSEKVIVLFQTFSLILTWGPYPLSDFRVIGGIIGWRRPIVPPITLWVWPIYWVTGQPIDRRPLSPGDRCHRATTFAGWWKTADLYQACLIFLGTQVPSGYIPRRTYRF